MTKEELEKTDFGSLNLQEILNDPQWATLEEEPSNTEIKKPLVNHKELMASLLEMESPEYGIFKVGSGLKKKKQAKMMMSIKIK
jgi:hypothetical protein